MTAGHLVYPGSSSLFENLDNVTTTATRTIVASGYCVLDQINIQVDSAATSSSDFDIELQTADGTSLHKWGSLDPVNTASLVRDGLSCGPYGIRSRRGLQVVLTNNDTASSVIVLNYLYRDGHA